MQRAVCHSIGRRIATVAVVGLFGASALGVPMTVDLISGEFEGKAAHAGNKHKSKNKHKGQAAGHAAKSYLKVTGKGPPPWAPAHGYRRKHGQTAYVPPFGIDLGQCNRELIGNVLGAAAGGALGSNVGSGSGRTAAIIGGTLIGFIVGGSIGRSMDQLDQNCVGQILEHGPSEKTVQWQNPDTGAAYEVTPTSTHNDSQGRYCREYQTTSTIGGEIVERYGTACRQPDGSWQLVS